MVGGSGSSHVNEYGDTEFVGEQHFEEYNPGKFDSRDFAQDYERVDSFEHLKGKAEEGGSMLGPVLLVGGAATVLAGMRYGPRVWTRLTTMSTYYKGGFEETMNRREALLILGLREPATKNRVRDAHRRIMLLNHPDKGGSPYIASKINEAKVLLDK